jgi:replication factor C subunit 3/5
MDEHKTEIWVEKYRPTNFNDIVLTPINQTIFKNIIDMDYFPNLLFYGPPGTGKTTTIINLINEYQRRYSKINNGTIIHLNASDDRGVEIIRTQIHNFVISNSMFSNGMKFVILDECDYMTKNAQQALRQLLQNYYKNVRFCLICNYISKIEESLKNEFLCLRFNQLNKEHIIQFLEHINKCENLNLNNESLSLIQKKFNYDIRSMINFMQSKYKEFINDDELFISDTLFEELYQKIIDKNLIKLIEINEFIDDISLKYSIDKKYILNDFINFLLIHKKNIINSQFLNIVTNVIHTQDFKSNYHINYFILSLRQQQQQTYNN